MLLTLLMYTMNDKLHCLSNIYQSTLIMRNMQKIDTC